LLDAFEIRTLNLWVYLLKTSHDIPGLIGLISEEKGVIHAQPNFIFRTMSDPMAGIQRVRNILRLDILHNNHLRGRGATVAIIDTGVDTRHEDLKQNVRKIENFFPRSPYRGEIHGTAMAGIIAAGINGSGIVGIAPEAGIIALRACRQIFEKVPQGVCYSSTIARAVDVAIHESADITNISAGSLEPDPLVSKLLSEGAKRGIVFVAPAGNMPSQHRLFFPASHPSVVSVSGIDANGNYLPDEALMRESDVVAPAEDILTTVPENGYNFLSGTSVSSAIVSGIIAIAKGMGRDVRLQGLPPRQEDLCLWEEALLKIEICR